VLAEPVLLMGLIEACRATIAANSEHLCALDRAIGDGDHGTNMRRGCEAVSAEDASVSTLPLPDALEKIGLTLVMSIGGAAGPLYGTLLMEMGRELRAAEEEKDFSSALKQAINAVARVVARIPETRRFLMFSIPSRTRSLIDCLGRTLHARPNVLPS